MQSEKDLQFYYVCEIKEEAFWQVCTDNQLQIENVKELPTCLKQTFEQIVQGALKCNFTLDNENGDAVMSVILESEFTNMQILYLPIFRQIDDTDVNLRVAHRVNAFRQKN